MKVVGGVGNWRRVRGAAFGFMNTVDDVMAQLDNELPEKLPRLHQAKRIWIASDYGGQHADAAFESYAFLFAADTSLGEWAAKCTSVRRRWLSDGRRMAFKNLRDRVRSEALEAFLAAADELEGVAVVFAVDRSVKSLFTEGSEPLAPDSSGEMAHWRASS